MVRKPIQNFKDNIKEVETLLAIHEALTGEKPGRRDYYVAVLNRSGVVLLVACWEVFIEDLADKTFSALLAKAQNPSYFPKEVQKLFVKYIKEDKNELRVLELTGNGWKGTFKQYKAAMAKQFLGGFNTPSAENIDKLFANLIGLNKMSKSWSRPRTTPADARLRLRRLIKLRGDIAHRVKSKKPIHKATVKKHVEFIRRLAEHSNTRVDHYLKSLKSKHGITSQ